VCAALSDLDFSSDDSSSFEEDERPKHKTGDFTGLCLIGKSSRHIADSDSDVVMIHPPRVFLRESLSVRMLFATRTSCFARFFVRTRG
jgi:hypothetical protein